MAKGRKCSGIRRKTYTKRTNICAARNRDVDPVSADQTTTSMNVTTTSPEANINAGTSSNQNNVVEVSTKTKHDLMGCAVPEGLIPPGRYYVPAKPISLNADQKLEVKGDKLRLEVVPNTPRTVVPIPVPEDGYIQPGTYINPIKKVAEPPTTEDGYILPGTYSNVLKDGYIQPGTYINPTTSNQPIVRKTNDIVSQPGTSSSKTKKVSAIPVSEDGQLETNMFTGRCIKKKGKPTENRPKSAPSSTDNTLSQTVIATPESLSTYAQYQSQFFSASSKEKHPKSKKQADIHQLVPERVVELPAGVSTRSYFTFMEFIISQGYPDTLQNVVIRRCVSLDSVRGTQESLVDGTKKTTTATAEDSQNRGDRNPFVNQDLPEYNSETDPEKESSNTLKFLDAYEEGQFDPFAQHTIDRLPNADFNTDQQFPFNAQLNTASNMNYNKVPNEHDNMQFPPDNAPSCIEKHFGFPLHPHYYPVRRYDEMEMKRLESKRHVGNWFFRKNTEQSITKKLRQREKRIQEREWQAYMTERKQLNKQKYKEWLERKEAEAFIKKEEAWLRKIKEDGMKRDQRDRSIRGKLAYRDWLDKVNSRALFRKSMGVQSGRNHSMGYFNRSQWVPKVEIGTVPENHNNIIILL